MTTRHLQARVCPHCAKPFETEYAARFCSRRCGMLAVGLQQRFKEPDRPADQTPLRSLYSATCLSCGRVQGEWSLTPVEAHQHAVRGLRRCGQCGGACFLEAGMLTRGVGRP